MRKPLMLSTIALAMAIAILAPPSNAADVTASWYDGTTDYRIARTVSVPADSTLILVGKDAPIYLEEGQSIRGGASAASDLEVVISYEELDDA